MILLGCGRVGGRVGPPGRGCGRVCLFDRSFARSSLLIVFPTMPDRATHRGHYLSMDLIGSCERSTVRDFKGIANPRTATSWISEASSSRQRHPRNILFSAISFDWQEPATSHPCCLARASSIPCTSSPPYPSAQREPATTHPICLAGASGIP